jgi:S1-C subfamily serine protease
MGDLIGINTPIGGNSGGSQGIGFAVPINMARHDLDQIVAHGKVERGYLGILPQNITPALAKAFNTSDVNGDQVSNASKAAEAGLQRGDVIEQVNRLPVTNVEDFSQAVRKSRQDAPVLLLVHREGSTILLAV